ncbi:MAG TPA: Mov34/MPN/PAD-1 family protein, partial [Anaerolineaceae bacterium]|nr:Mov34/MPN/PAD-1 family protein [Anaerolineaceae bacterium]
LLRALTQFEEHDLDVVAIFHSHPAGPARPSVTDVEAFNYPGAATLIWSPGGDGWQVRAFEISGQDVAAVSLIWVADRNESCA